MNLAVLTETGGECHMAGCVQRVAGLNLLDLKTQPFGRSERAFDIGTIEAKQRRAGGCALQIGGVAARIGGVAGAHQRFGRRCRRACNEGAATGFEAPSGAAGTMSHAASIAPATRCGQLGSGSLDRGGFEHHSFGRLAEEVTLALGAAPAGERFELGLLLDALGRAADAEAA